MDLATLLAQAEKRLRRHGDHPVTIVVTFEGLPNPVHRTFASLPATPQQREAVLFLKGKQFAEQYGTRRVQRVWFVCEAWMSLVQTNTFSSIAPSLDPKRQEVVLLVELDATSAALSQQCEVRAIQRTRSGAVKALLPIPELTAAQGSLSMAGVLLLSFLEGFAQAASHDYGPLQTMIQQHRRRLEAL
jgi:hypothetical protein